MATIYAGASNAFPKSYLAATITSRPQLHQHNTFFLRRPSISFSPNSFSETPKAAVQPCVALAQASPFSGKFGQNSGDEQSLTFDSYTIPEDDLELGQSRLLEVDDRVVVPAKTHLRMILTPADVPHSRAVPSSGVKRDAVPGRLNQTSISVQRGGVYYESHRFTTLPVRVSSSDEAANSVQAEELLSGLKEKLPKIMELVGLGYSGWFVYRYLFKSSRKELATDIEVLKKKIAGSE